MDLLFLFVADVSVTGQNNHNRADQLQSPDFVVHYNPEMKV